MHIGILQTGLVPDALKPEMGDYPAMFADLLDGHGFTFTTWVVCDGEIPPGIDAAEGWLITGSRHGAYEQHPWIAPLEEFIRAVNGARRPMVGICFGHQIIAQALGGRVEKFSGGWAVGRTAYDFEGQTMYLNAWHQDQVVAPPPGARTVARNDFCAHAALAYGDHIFTVQAHPEHSPAFHKGLIETRGRGLVPEALLARAEADLDKPLGNGAMADRLAGVLKAAAHVEV